MRPRHAEIPPGQTERYARRDGMWARVTSVRIRGIYATALTALLAESETVVDVSPPIRARFDHSFPVEEPDVRIETTSDRQGVVLHGMQSGIESITEQVCTQGLDALSWGARCPADAIMIGLITDTDGRRATVDLDGATGSLSVDEFDRYLDTGDTVHVRIENPAPPWSDRHHRLSPDITVRGTLASLERGVDATVVGTPGNETALARTTELLDIELPDGWGIRWHPAARDADMAALEEAISTLASRAETVDREIAAVEDDADAPALVAAPRHGGWIWFGRDTRFALDDIREDVTETLPGHHRIKAGGREASTAVDFAERLGNAIESFPTQAVFEQFGPAVGDRVAVRHGKPDGRCYSLGDAEVTERDPDSGTFTIERTIQSSGSYDGLGTDRQAGDIASTRIREGRWWYPTTYRSEEGTSRGTYVNIATPVEVYPDAIRYVDLHVDVIQTPDGSVDVVDMDELEDAEERGDLPVSLAKRAREVAESVESALRD